MASVQHDEYHYNSKSLVHGRLLPFYTTWACYLLVAGSPILYAFSFLVEDIRILANILAGACQYLFVSVLPGVPLNLWVRKTATCQSFLKFNKWVSSKAIYYFNKSANLILGVESSLKNLIFLLLNMVQRSRRIAWW